MRIVGKMRVEIGGAAFIWGPREGGQILRVDQAHLSLPPLDGEKNLQENWKSFPPACGWDTMLHMWSGGRSLRLIAVAGLLAFSGTAPGQTPLCNGQHPGNPELISGAASCIFNEVAGAGQTLILLDENSIILWDHLGLGNPDSTLSFEWNGAAPPNAAVLNRVVSGNAGRGGSLHNVEGNISFQDGALIVINPNSALDLHGMVAARSLLFATHHVDPIVEQQLLDGLGGDFTGSSQPLRVIDGHLVALDGDAILAGRSVQVSALQNPADDGAEIRALNGSVRIFGGENFRLLPSGSERLQRLPGGGDGSVNSSKTVQANQDIEILAENRIENNGRIEGNFLTGTAFLRVDMGGDIINHNIILASEIESSVPSFGTGIELTPDTDSPSPLSTGMSRFPVVRSPGQKQSSRTVVVYESAPSTGTASAQRQRSNRRALQGSRPNTQVARNTTATRGRHLARGKSFFGVRGGTPAKKK